MRRHWKRRLPILLLLIAVLACTAPFTYPYLALRVYVQSTLNAVPKPAGAQKIAQANYIEPQCHMALIREYYIADISRDDLIVFYGSFFARTRPWTVALNSGAGLTSLWVFSASDKQNQELRLSISLLKRSSQVPNRAAEDIAHEALISGRSAYVVTVKYIEDQDLYEDSECFMD
jgi:hypothetical protein